MAKLEDYLNLLYRLEVTPLGEEDGGGFYARYPELGEMAAHGDGPTVEAAVREADTAKRLVLEVMLEHGDPIPLPESMRGVERQVQRAGAEGSLPRAGRRGAEGVNLNQLVVSLLSRELSTRHR